MNNESGRFDKFTKKYDSDSPKSDPFKEISIERHFHWMHWLILILSLIITLGAWQIASRQNEDKIEAKFKLEARRIVELTVNRLQRYEDGLVGSIAAIKSHSFGMEHLEWRRFAKNLQIDIKYPGINGIGIIFNLPTKGKELEEYLKLNRKTRPGYKVHPSHDQKELWPITFIEPEASNMKAIGLDMAHENNRYSAIKNARDSGLPKITGPIVLVQDSKKTPGFLFYVPYYKETETTTVEQRRESLLGVVYAPFIVKNLMHGILSEEDRHVNIKITDEDEVVYDEIEKLQETDFKPLYHKTKEIDVYGRKWKFKIINNETFDMATQNSQPTFILIAGIIIDLLILLFFLFLKRSNEQAVSIANKLIVKEEKRRARAQGFSKMATLGEMASGIAHEINNPVAIICGYAGQLKMLSSMNKFDKDKFVEISDKIDKTGHRISKIIKGLKSYSRDASLDPKQSVKLETIIDDTLALCTEKFRQNSIKLTRPSLIETIDVYCRPVEISQVLLNLLNNAYDAIESLEDKWISINVRQDNNWLYLEIQDSGKTPINIAEKIFDPFYTTKEIGKGTGLGLSICYGIVEKHGGNLSLDSNSDTTKFIIKLPVKRRV